MSASLAVSGVCVLVQQQLTTQGCAEPDTSRGGSSRKAL